MNRASRDVKITGGNPDSAGFGVYVHWPFCAAKCPYCDFNSHVRHGGVDEAAFRDALIGEIRQTAKEIGRRETGSVFFGGGTPSLMSGATVAAILEAIDRAWPLEEACEVTLEANPTSVEAERLRDFRAAGVNRVSLGVQSLRDDQLKALGRLHTVDEALRAVKLAQTIFERVSFDLIYARPGQTADDWRAELSEALALAVGHLSLYQLTIEPDTPFAALHAAGRLHVPDADLADALYEITQDLTSAAGLPQYETSNHASEGARCRHNLLYWRYGEYAGIGPGAHGRLISEDGGRRATSTERMPETWREMVASQDHGRTAFEALDKAEIADEALLMGLRLVDGLDLARLHALSGMVLCPQTIAGLSEAGMVAMSQDGRRLRALPAGRFVLDRIVLELSATMQPRADAVHNRV